MNKIRTKFLFVFLFFAVLMIVGDSKGFLSPVKGALLFALSPFERGAYLVRNSVLESVSFLAFWKSGEMRIKNLEQRNLELVSTANRVEQLEQENGELRKQLNADLFPEQKKIPAEVLGVGRFMTINRGLRDQVLAGQTVVYLDNLVGRVERAEFATSLVKLPTDSNGKIPVKIGISGSVKGIAIGQFNSAVILDQVAQNEEFKIADLIFTSGDGGTYSSDLVVGKVKRVVSSQTDLFKKAEVEPLVRYDRLKTVFVLIP